jgi:hypothetical protein
MVLIGVAALALIHLALASVAQTDPHRSPVLQPTDDAYDSFISPTIPMGVADPDYLILQGSRAPTTQCNTTKYTWLKFDLASLSGDATTATLRLSNPQYTGPATGVVLGLFAVADDTWTEDTLTWENHPASSIVSPALALRAPPPNGQPNYGFSSPELMNYINGERNGDGLASLVLAYVDCPSLSAPQSRVSSKEGQAAPLLLLDELYRVWLPLILYNR